MGFVNQIPRIYSLSNVQALNLNQNGVYGLLSNGACIYVGKGDIRQRLLDHLNGDNPLIIRYKPTHWIDEVVAGDPSNREKQLIAELRPICNQRIG